MLVKMKFYAFIFLSLLLSVAGSKISMAGMITFSGLPDNGTTPDGTFVVSKTIVKVCDNLDSSKAVEDDALDNCLTDMNAKQYGPQIGKPETAIQYKAAVKEYAAAYIAEALRAKVETEEYVDKVIDAVDFAPSPNEKDARANLVEMGKIIVKSMNGLVKVYSSRLALDTFSNYRSQKFLSKEAQEAVDDGQDPNEIGKEG